jgi:hypothetical protein
MKLFASFSFSNVLRIIYVSVETELGSEIIGTANIWWGKESLPEPDFEIITLAYLCIPCL